ncbi:MAG: RHS repeat-associated core domain-containing protein [Opitutales bacterium]|nr:RHS repeat-associated core domain-containing protein [Opitutales bacterium]
MSLRGSQSEDPTGLVYYGLRYYNPETGRFINRDPIGLAGVHNLYAIVGNNPMNAWDVRGLQSNVENNGFYIFKTNDPSVDNPYIVWDASDLAAWGLTSAPSQINMGRIGSSVNEDPSALGAIPYYYVSSYSGSTISELFTDADYSYMNFGNYDSAYNCRAPDLQPRWDLIALLASPYTTDADIEKWLRNNGFPVGNSSKSSDSSKEVTQPDKEKDVSPEFSDGFIGDSSNPQIATSDEVFVDRYQISGDSALHGYSGIDGDCLYVAITELLIYNKTIKIYEPDDYSVVRRLRLNIEMGRPPASLNSRGVSNDNVSFVFEAAETEYGVSFLTNSYNSLTDALFAQQKLGKPSVFIFKGHAMAIFYNAKMGYYEVSNATVSPVVKFTLEDVDEDEIYLYNRIFRFDKTTPVYSIKD